MSADTTTSAGTTTDLDHRTYWDEGFTWSAYLSEEVEEHRGLWEGIYRRPASPRPSPGWSSGW